MLRPVVVLLDPYHPYAGEFAAVAARRWGLDSVCLWSDTSPWDRSRGTRYLERAGSVVAHHSVRLASLEADAEALGRRYDVVGVLPHFEDRLEAAVTVAESLGVAWADPTDLRRFRTKSALKAHLRSVPGGPRINATVAVRTRLDIRAARETGPFDRFVLKPDDGMSNNRIGLFDGQVTDDQLDTYLGSTRGGLLVMEEFLDGAEYCVNGQVDEHGVVTTLSVYRTHHTSANGRTQLAERFELVRHDSPLFARLAGYASDVLVAARLRRSPFHLEVMVDADGPCLIEVGARLAGVSMAYDVGVAHAGAVDAFELAVQHYLGRASEQPLHPDWTAYDARTLRVVCGISDETVRAASWAGVYEVEAMPEFVHWVSKPRAGQRIEPTLDLATSPWQVTIAARSAEQLDAVEARVRHLVGWNRSGVDRTRTGLNMHATVVRTSSRLRLVPGAVRTRPSPLAAPGMGARPSEPGALESDARREGRDMLKRVVKRVGYAGPVRRTITRSSGLGRVTGRFVGGPDELSAVEVAQSLQHQGLLTTLHVRQGNPLDEAGADEHVDLYRRLVARHVAAGLGAGSEISLKMAQFGLLAPGGLDGAVERMRRTVADAYAAGIAVTVDMEGIEEVDVTLDAVCRLRAVQPDVGVAIQAYLLRSETDCRTLAGTGARVRLVKGAYGAGADIAHTTRGAVDSAYGRCLAILFDGGAHPMVASHDLRMLEVARRLAREAGRNQDAYEIQMLMGVRTPDQLRLVAEGERVRVYVPYGPDWYGWFVNRIVEKPGNVRLLAHALVSPGPRI